MAERLLTVRGDNGVCRVLVWVN